MVQNKIPISTSDIQWRCVESKMENKRLHYGRFAISPLQTGQASILGIAIRKTLLGEVEGTCITSAKIQKAIHEYATLTGVKESVHDILLNLKDIVFEDIKQDTKQKQEGFIIVQGPGNVTAADIDLPPSLKITDPDQHIANLTKSVKLEIELVIEKGKGYKIQDQTKFGNGYFCVDAVFTPIRNVNYSIHSFESDIANQELLFLEIWTNGSLSPKQALYEASQRIIHLFLPFLDPENPKDLDEKENKNQSHLSSILSSQSLVTEIEKNKRDAALKEVFIDQLELPARAYNCLKRVNVNTVSDLLDYTYEDLLRIKNFGKKSAEQVVLALQERFGIDLLKQQLN